MKTILVPTDFSENADNALAFAAGLNKKLKAKIIIYHTFHIPLVATDIPIPVQTEEELTLDSLRMLNKTEKKIRLNYPDMDFAIETSQGFADEEIVSLEKKYNCDLVIMGTHGASGITELLMGSNTGRVMEKSVCPVLAVPEGAKITDMKKIVFAAEYGAHTFENVYKVVELARLFDSEVILLHITKGRFDENFEYAELEAFKRKAVEESKYPKISFRLLEDKDVFHGLSLYLEEIKGDLLVLNMRHHAFVQRIFSRSLTKRMAYHSHIPVLALHMAG